MESSQPEQETQTDSALQLLGNEIDHYSIRFQLLNRWLVVILGLILLLDAILLTLLSIFNLWDAIQSHGRAILLVRIAEPIIALFLVLPVGIFLIIFAALNWQNGLTIYENGLICRKRNRERIWYWDDIERFDNQITLVKFSGTTLTSRKRIILEDNQHNHLIIRNQYDRMDELITHMRKFILQGLFNKIRRKLGQRGEVSFHSEIIAVREGLLIKEYFIPWNELQIKPDKKGKLQIIYQPDEQVLFQSKINQIKNLDVLMYLVENPPDRIY